MHCIWYAQTLPMIIGTSIVLTRLTLNGPPGGLTSSDRV